MSPETIQKRERVVNLLKNEDNNRSNDTSVIESAVYTIGYQGLAVDKFLRFLIENGIQRLIDVRKNPISRVFGFHKSTLSWFADYLEIEYIHRPDLGVPSEWRKDLSQPEDYEELFQRYKDEILTQSEEALYDLSQMMGYKPSALMCYEADPSFCHRSCIAESISLISSMDIHDLRSENEEHQ